MNLRNYDQVLELHQVEAEALSHALRLYHQRLELFAEWRPLHLLELLSLKPTTRLLTRLSKLVAGTWPRDRRQRPRPRQWRLEVDELLVLNRLFLHETLFAAQLEHRVAFTSLLCKVNQKAVSLPPLFEL